MRIERIGFTPLKGGRHRAHATVDLTGTGPAGDRVFCLVDRAAGKVLRTVQNPSLVQAASRWESGVLTVDLPHRTVEGVPAPTGELVELDYWGRPAELEICDGPWAQAFGEHLGYDVSLARAVRAGEVVYGGCVSIVTTSSLRLLSERLGRDIEPARFRPTFVIDTGDLPAHAEDGWAGRTLRLGQDARVTVRQPIPRCAGVDLDPDKGVRDAPVLAELGGYRQGRDGLDFGVDAAVSTAGRVRTGDQVELERG